MKNIYIAGPISGLDPEVAKKNFELATEILHKTFSIRANILNPFALVKYNEDYEWKDYMIKCMPIIFNCDSIYMLEDWQKSKGARIEFAIAVELGFDIIYQVPHKSSIS